MKPIKQPHSFSIGDHILTLKEPAEVGTIKAIYEDDRICCSFLKSDGTHLSTYERIVYPNEITLDPVYYRNAQLPKWEFCKVKGVGKTIMKVEKFQLLRTRENPTQKVTCIWEDKHGSLKRETFELSAVEGVDDIRGCGKAQLEEKIKVDAITSSLSPLDVITPNEMNQILHYLLCVIDASRTEPESVHAKFERCLAQLRPELFMKLWPGKPMPSKKS